MKIRLNGLLIGVMVACFAVFIGNCRIVQNKKPPRAIKGVLDLADWDFAKDGPIDLAGEYEFYWQQHLNPATFSRAHPPQKNGFMTAPAYWKGEELEGTKLPATGYATYRLIVFLNDSRPAKLALKFLVMGTAYTAFVNGEKISSVGAAGRTPETTVPRYFPQVVDFAPDSNRIELIYLVSNFHHIRGGAWEPIRLGTVEQINQIRKSRLALDLILFGSILIMGLYHLALFSPRGNDRPALFLGLFCLLIAVRFLTIAERFLVHIFPGMSWELFVKVEYLAFCPAPAVFALFGYSVFSQDLHKPIIAAIVAVSLFFSSLICVTSARIFTQTIFVFQVFVMACIAYMFFMLVLCAIRKRESAGIFLIGSLFLATTTINDILYTNGIIQTGFFVHWGLVIFIFSQAFMLSVRHAKAFTTVAAQRLELEKSNTQYEREVIERKRTSEALRHSEEMYRALYEDNPSMYFTVDAAGAVLSVNRFGAEQLGYTVAELVGQSVLNVFFEPDKPAVRRQLTVCLQNSKQLYNWEVRKVRKDGSLLWVGETARAVQDQNGGFVVLIVCEDITAHKQAEHEIRQLNEELEQRVIARTQALRESQEQFQQIAENINEVFWMESRDTGRLLYVSPIYEKVWGRTCQSLHEQPNSFMETVHPEDGERFKAHLIKQRNGEHSEIQYRIIRPDGAIRWIWDRSFPIRAGDGHVYRTAGVAQDVTERKLAQEANEQLRQRNIRVIAIVEAQENERRRYSSELHDGLGQILTGIKFGMETFKPIISAISAEQAKTFSTMQDLLDTAITEGKRIALNLMPRVLDDLGIVPALELLCRQVEQQRGMKVSFKADPMNGRLPANVEMGLYRIAQEAFNNIVKHAEAKAAAVHLVPDAGTILMIIEDDGRGFHTPAINNNGHRGMMNMYERAAALNGTLAIDSQPGKGTKVFVELPRGED